MGVDVVDETFVRCHPQSGRNLPTGLETVERAKRERREARHTPHVGQPSVEGVPLRHLAAPHGGKEAEPTGAPPGNEVHEDIQRALVGPVEVVHEQRDRSGVGQPVDPLIEGDGHLRCRTTVLTDRRRRDPGVVTQSAKGGPERQEGHRHRAEGQRSSLEQGPAPTQRAQDMVDERGLADACVTGHEDRRGRSRAGRVKDAPDVAGLALTSDEGPSRPVYHLVSLACMPQRGRGFS